MQLNTLQNNRYKIQAILGQGGYGITYLAEQTTLGRQVAIKEFFMKDHCGRAAGSPEVTLGTDGSREMLLRYREKFKKEAATLARLNHPNIVRVIDMFEENNTYSSEFGIRNLSKKVKRQLEKAAVSFGNFIDI